MNVGSKECTVDNNVCPIGSKLCSGDSALLSGRNKFCSVGKKLCATDRKFCTTDSKQCTTPNKFWRSHNKFLRRRNMFSRSSSNMPWRQPRLYKEGARPASSHHEFDETRVSGAMMNAKLTATQHSVCGLRNALVVHEPKRELMVRSASRRHRDEVVQQLTGGVTPEKAIRMQAKIQTLYIKKFGARSGSATRSPWFG